MKITSQNSPDFAAHKTNLSTYNRILKQSIKIAKKKYYNSLFDKFETDLKNTWATIGDILNRNNKYIYVVIKEYLIMKTWKQYLAFVCL